MKIIVSNAEKNHADQLLQVLQKKQWLQSYYTLFFSNRLLKLPFVGFLSAVKSQLKKYYYRSYASNFHHRPFLFFRSRRMKDLSAKIRTVYHEFDGWVADETEKNNPDLVIAFENSNAQTFDRAKKAGIITVLDLAQIHHNTISSIFSTHKLLQELEAEKDPVMNTLKEKALANTDYVFTVSGFAKETMVSNGFPEDRVFIHHLPVNTGLFYPKKDYDLSERKIRLLFAGTVSERKGIYVLLQVMKDLQQFPVELTVVGPAGNAISGLLKAAEELGNITYIPFLHHENLADQYRKADIFVFPSLLDSWAQTVIEAMACGLPAIVTTNTGAKDAVQEGGGFVVKAGDVDALKKNIFYYCNNRTDIEKHGRRAAAIAAGFTAENYERCVTDSILAIKSRN